MRYTLYSLMSTGSCWALTVGIRTRNDAAVPTYTAKYSTTSSICSCIISHLSRTPAL